MKKNILLIITLFLMLFVSLKSYAFDYTITFTGTGASTTVESVIVQNLTKGTTVTVPTGNSLNLSDAPNAVEQLSATDEFIRVYTNSVDGKSTVSFFAKQAGSTQLNAFSIDGRKVIGINQNLQTGINSFQLSLPKGSFVIQVVGNGYTYTAKMINQTGKQSKPEIVYVGTEKPLFSAPQKSKSSTLGTTTMTYTTGDQLLYKGISGNYSTIVTDVPTGSKTMNFDFVTCQDADLNNYSVVTIGTQTWMASNLRVTHYRNGESITYLTVAADWRGVTSGAWCDYSNLAANGTKYGHLYNWYAVADSRNIAPVGWHVPTDAEWTTLTTYLGGGSVAGGKLKEAGTLNWLSPNTGATNETGFSALPGGYRVGSAFNDVGHSGIWWSSTENNSPHAWYMGVAYSYGYVNQSYDYKVNGFSVRCLRDLPASIITSSASIVTTNSATSGGNVTNDGGVQITARGVCWSTSPSPTIALSTKTTETGTTGSFTSLITGLSANTTYYIRAYATNDAGTGYGNEDSFKTFAVAVMDIDGNGYHSVTIGTQTWMAENLKTTRYRNGEAIGTTTPATKDIQNESTPKYQWAYNGDENLAAKYGRFYTWYAVTDSRNIAPTGWHVPTDAEWTTLENYLIANGYNYDGTTSGNKIAKSLAATADWGPQLDTGQIGNDLTKNNTSGFTALPGGYRDGSGAFYYIGTNGTWWSSTEYTTSDAWFWYLHIYNIGLNRGPYTKSYGRAVRCVRDY